MVVIEGDNECAVGLENNLAQERKTRHIAMRIHWVRDQVRLGIIDVVWRKNVYNLGDFLTKKMRSKEEYRRGRDAYIVSV